MHLSRLPRLEGRRPHLPRLESRRLRTVGLAIGPRQGGGAPTSGPPCLPVCRHGRGVHNPDGGPVGRVGQRCSLTRLLGGVAVQQLSGGETLYQRERDCTREREIGMDSDQKQRDTINSYLTACEQLPCGCPLTAHAQTPAHV